MTEELKRKIGQMFMVGITGEKLSPEQKAFCEKYKIGNYCLNAQNCISSESLCSLTKELRSVTYRAAGVYPFISIDQEGGWVTRFYEGTALIPGAMSYSAAGADREKMISVGGKLGRILRAAGCNMDNAPVLDVNLNPENPIISSRAYGDTPEQAAGLGVGFSVGLQSAGVVTAVKHFPGHGNVCGDTHLGDVHNAGSREVLQKTEFVPFQRAFEAGTGAIMCAHVILDAYSDRPCTVSPEIITDLLRHEMHFDGVAVTDAMEMRAISRRYSLGEAAVLAILAGCDILLYYTFRSANVAEAVEAVYEAVESGRIPAARIDEAYGRILRQKEKYKIADGEPDPMLLKKLLSDEAELARVFDDKLRSVTCMKDDGVLDTLADKKLLCVAPVCDAIRGVEERSRQILSFADLFKKEFEQAEACVSSLDGLTPDVEKAVKGEYDVAVLGVFNAGLKPGQLDVLKALEKTGKPVVAVLLGSPYDWKYTANCRAVITGYEYTRLSVKAVLHAMKNRCYPGKLPITLP